ncbi:hypothetical protein ATKI12_0397 [Kitasatospora sp. Ki12]
MVPSCHTRIPTEMASASAYSWNQSGCSIDASQSTRRYSRIRWSPAFNSRVTSSTSSTEGFLFPPSVRETTVRSQCRSLPTSSCVYPTASRAYLSSSPNMIAELAVVPCLVFRCAMTAPSCAAHVPHVDLASPYLRSPDD